MADLFVVRRRRCCWERPDDLEEPCAVAVFTRRAAAEAEALLRSRRHLQEKLPRASPFSVDWPSEEDAVQDLSSLTTLPPFVLRDWLLDAGFPDDGPQAVPDAERAGYGDWWEWWQHVLSGVYEQATNNGQWVQTVPPYPLTADQLARFWEAMNLVPVFDVVAVDWHESVTRGTP